MKIRKLNREELNEALPLIWKVFFDYETVNYPETETGIQFVPMEYRR